MHYKRGNMRLPEIITPVLLAAYLLWHHPRPIAIRYLPLAALTITLLPLAFEGYRWQMIPIYVLTLILTALSIFAVDIKLPASILSLILLALSTAIPILLPVPQIPAPSGPYDVGTRIYELTDESRREIFSMFKIRNMTK